MTTLADVVAEVDAHLHGYTAEQEQLSTLTETVASSSLSLRLDDVTQVSRGLIEIDDELIYVRQVDEMTGEALIPAWGRGMNGSVAAAHAAGAKVVNSPTFPRHRIAQTVNEVVDSLSPDLFAVKTDDTQLVRAARVAYEVPADLEKIVDLRFEDIGPSGMWARVNRWRLDLNADPAQFPSGRCVEIYSGMIPGRTLKITYRTNLSRFATSASTLADTGLAESARDVLVLGAAARMLAAREAAHLFDNAVEQSNTGQTIQRGSATAASRALYALFMQRVDQERRRLHLLYPTMTHLER